jgi:hypothetical protein
VLWSSCRCRLGYTSHLGSGNAARLALAVVVVAPMLAALRTVVAGSCGRVRFHVSGYPTRRARVHTRGKSDALSVGTDEHSVRRR